MKLLCLLFFSLPFAAIGQEQGSIASGTPWETQYYIEDSGVEGPTILLVGGMHGNEPAGAEAADQIRHWPLLKGRLVVIPRANRLALAAGSRRIPDLPTDLNDLNRNFPRSDEPDEARSELGQAIWEFVKEMKPDWVIDLHEGFAVHRQNPKSVGSSILCNPSPEVGMHFEHALAAVNASIEDPEKLFVLKDDTETANGSLVRASMQRLGAIGAIFETTYEKQALAVRIRQHRLMVHRVLTNLEMIANHPDELVFRNESDATRYVAIYEDLGTSGLGPAAIRDQLATLPKSTITKIIGGAEIRNGALDDFDALIVPGGSGSKQAVSMGESGREMVREFVEAGGAYMGVCAGCYLACENFSWGLKILDAKTLSSKWQRGRTFLDLQFEENAANKLGLPSPETSVRYANGPVMGPAHSAEIPDYETVALFLTEISENDAPEGIQIGSPAILRGDFGKGRVVGISPHPEQTEGLEFLVPKLLSWALRVE